MLDTKITETAAAKANAALIKSAYDAFSRGDIQGAMATFAEDIFWHVPGRGPLSRDYRGHAEVLGFFGHFMKLSGGTFRLQVDEERGDWEGMGQGRFQPEPRATGEKEGKKKES